MTASAAAKTEYLPTIGLEVHAQLLTSSKMFCSCAADYSGAAPNTLVCPVCLGLPGSLPVINQRAVDQAIMVALALNCTVAELTKFDRKNYPYPDIPKGYQISQYDTPLARDGYVEIGADGDRERIGIIRVHLEEDTGKTIHAALDGREVSLVDYNRSGVPLLEIVSHADIHSPESARLYFTTLREILVYLGVNSGDMQEGALRADVNVSVARLGEEAGVKTEIKNLNSFRSVQRALQHEIDRQIKLLETGAVLTQETRGWDESQEITIPQRSKEFAEDYRYFPEPDLPPLYLDPAMVESIRQSLPGTAEAKRDRFVRELGLSAGDARVLTGEPALAALFEETVRLEPSIDPSQAANWLTGEFLRLVNETATPTGETGITAHSLQGLLRLLRDGRITNAIGKMVFEEMFRTGRGADEIVTERGLAQMSDESEVRSVVQKVLDENPVLVSDYLNKDRKTEGPLVGKVMAATRGTANAAIVKRVIAEILLDAG